MPVNLLHINMLNAECRIKELFQGAQQHILREVGEGTDENGLVGDRKRVAEHVASCEADC